MWRSMVAVAVVLFGGARLAYAQRYVELGANIGHACLMGEASCAHEVATRGWQAGLWLTDMTAIRFRHLDAPRPERTDVSQGYAVSWSNWGRSLWLVETTWHFGAPGPARPFVGVSAGARVDRLTVTCQPVACHELQRPIVVAAGGRTSHFSLGAVGGISIHPMRRLVMTLQVGSHDFPGEHIGTFVFSAHAAYRHPIGK